MGVCFLFQQLRPSLDQPFSGFRDEATPFNKKEINQNLHRSGKVQLCTIKLQTEFQLRLENRFHRLTEDDGMTCEWETLKSAVNEEAL
jgi:hypothetical protein